MSAILIKGSPEVQKKVAALAEKLGANILDLTDEQFEDFALGLAMDTQKTGELADEDAVMKKLRG
jgi:predicted transcriptional regulator